jgi:hypothetical protein
MKNSSKISIHLFIIQCFWSLHSHDLPKVQDMPVTLYCHGVGADASQVHDYTEMIQHPYQTFNFPDTQRPRGIGLNAMIYHGCNLIGRKNINRKKMFMGQGEDITTIKDQIESNKSYILYGLSRGGSAIINYMAEYNPKNVHALILDETPANMIDVMDNLKRPAKNMCAPESSAKATQPTHEASAGAAADKKAIEGATKKKKKSKKSKRVKKPLTEAQREKSFRRVFPAYPKGARSGIENISLIENKNLPVFLVYTRIGSRYHFPSSAWRLYLAFKQAGFKHIYLCELEEHSQHATGNDRKLYLERLHSMYKKHNFSHNPKHAVLTPEELQVLQPTEQQVHELLAAYENR